jgi:Family of unknown function (DUF5832)
MVNLGPTLTNLPGQLYVLFSCVGPECPQKNDMFGVKFYGAVQSVEVAKDYAKKLQSEDATFNIYVADTNQWLLIPPDGSKISDTHYVEEKLEEIMQGFKENQRMGASLFEKRKRDMIAQPLKNSDTPYIDPSDENSKYYTKPDEPPVRHPAEFLDALREEFPKATDETLRKIAELKSVAETECRKAERKPLDLPQDLESLLIE